MRVALVRRGLAYMQRRNQQHQANQGQPKSLKEFDEDKYGGLKSAKILFSDEPQQRRSLVGRFDWHVVQFLLALVPPAMVLLIVQWARYDMTKMEEKLGKKALVKESKRLASVVKHRQETSGTPASTDVESEAAAPVASSNNMEQRLSRLEELVVELQKQQAARAAQWVAAAQQQRTHASIAQAQGQQAARGRADIEQPQQQPLMEVQQQQHVTGQVLAGRLGSAWRWVGSKVLPGQQPSVAREDASASAEGECPGSSSRGYGRSRMNGSSSAGAAALHEGSGGPAAAVATAQEAAAAAAAGAAAALEQDRAASVGRRPPGNTANRLLHVLGQPIRWLWRQESTQPPGSP